MNKIALVNGADALYVQLAREIAIDHFDLEDILKRYSVGPEDWLDISNSPRFRDLLKAAIAEWQSATNTHERTKLKAAALMELYLEEANQRLFDPKEALNAKVELAKLVARIAGMGGPSAAEGLGGGGEKFSITINLGEDRKLNFEKSIRTIEGNVNDQ